MPQLTRASIAAHALFPAIEKQIARHLITIHNETPRLSRLKASHRKWLMTHAMFALSLSRRDDDPMSGLTATRFIEIVMRLAAASRNTATAYLAELLAYKFLREVPDVPDRRVRVFETTEVANAAMKRWFNGHMACLDRLDGGNREATTIADPRIFKLGQPIAAGILVADPLWRDPPDTIGHFLWSDLGGMVLHDLIARLGEFDRAAPRTPVGPVTLAELSEIYMISATNLKRMFKKAESEDLLGWDLPRRRGNLWLSQRFIEDYFTWQSAKFAALDVAYRESLQQLTIEQDAAA
ncbi:hypothetical protein PDO_4428 [Rhizobium sp. PDO1-076]|uniref:hypothetical protein n=1 Tax=Rhizobium sp. PDO1-076 TaxID=1125979 RepID=UPI00024E2732|nr:hypothetical protein [Rhizobium sp. PDO1-076]EHS53113.1 hypothetical protein PDO_4428 [Rhizobium sp. PDO1-076]